MFLIRPEKDDFSRIFLQFSAGKLLELPGKPVETQRKMEVVFRTGSCRTGSVMINMISGNENGQET